jgi:hypothetical protein
MSLFYTIMEQTLFDLQPKIVPRKSNENRRPNGQFCSRGMSEAEHWKSLYFKRENYVKYLESMVGIRKMT